MWYLLELVQRWTTRYACTRHTSGKKLLGTTSPSLESISTRKRCRPGSNRVTLYCSKKICRTQNSRPVRYRPSDDRDGKESTSCYSLASIDPHLDIYINTSYHNIFYYDIYRDFVLSDVLSSMQYTKSCVSSLCLMRFRLPMPIFQRTGHGYCVHVKYKAEEIEGGRKEQRQCNADVWYYIYIAIN